MTKPSLKPVDSKAMIAYGYDGATQTLCIRFGAGKVTHFREVPAHVAAEFDAAESKGRAYHSLIKGNFTGVVVPDEGGNFATSEAAPC